MVRIMLLGLLAGLFFSSTFILNRAMSLEGGHWFWSASLRYGYMFVMLVMGLTIISGPPYLRRLAGEFVRNWRFWVISGSIGFGGFYSLICFAADFAPGWVVATTWQLTIIASLVVLLGFGRTFSPQIWLFSLVVFSGVLLVNISQMETTDFTRLLLGVVPVLGAAFCYPLGNQLVWEAQNGHHRLPQVDGQLLRNGFAKVLLLTTGSIPFWTILGVLVKPAPPSGGQLISVALVAVFSGIAATTLFLNARHQASRASQLAAVDATQSSEVLFALGGEILFLGAGLPSGSALAGILITITGLIAFATHDHR